MWDKELYPLTQSNYTIYDLNYLPPLIFLECRRKLTHWFSSLWSLEIALCYMQTSLIMQERSQTGDDSIFADRLLTTCTLSLSFHRSICRRRDSSSDKSREINNPSVSTEPHACEWASYEYSSDFPIYCQLQCIDAVWRQCCVIIMYGCRNNCSIITSHD